MSADSSFNSHLDFNKLFEPDELMSAQFYQTTKRTYQANPELRLLAAVLEDAVASLMTDLRRCSKRQRRDFAEAMRWVVDRDDDDWHFSFVNVCEILTIDPEYLRAGLIRKVNQIRDTKPSDPQVNRSYLPARRKVVRMHAGRV
ncbi:MAG: hypothetical protein HW419_276 [Deltaproteobacteria bacterium]|nr:hypothetical protein [Deltaproteobacteria bacterium]